MRPETVESLPRFENHPGGHAEQSRFFGRVGRLANDDSRIAPMPWISLGETLIGGSTA